MYVGKRWINFLNGEWNVGADKNPILMSHHGVKTTGNKKIVLKNDD